LSGIDDDNIAAAALSASRIAGTAEVQSNKGAANGYAALNGSSLVAQNPASAQASPAASKIPLSDGVGRLDDGWLSANVSLLGSSISLTTEVTGTLPEANVDSAITRDSEWPSASATLINKTMDAEGTGNILTTVSKVWLEAAGCQNTTAALMWDTPISNPAVAACVTGTNTQKGVADFADSANLSMQRTLLLPADWTGNVDVLVKWLTSATTGSVVWQVATSCVADGETDDPSFNASSTVTDTAKGTANQTNDAAITSLTMTGCTAGEMVHLKVFRDSAHASDSLAATARLVGIELTLRRAQ
jgi:hypothetical protein